MANHPPRITDSNIRIPLSEGSLNGPCPRDDSGLGWVQIQRKSLFWEEKIDVFSIITHEGLTTLSDPQIGWTITSGMWNTLRTLWVLNMKTIKRIHELTSSPQPDTSFRRSDILGKWTEYMVSQRWWIQLFSRQYPKTMKPGGSHRIRKPFTCGTRWTTRIGTILWQNF